MRCLRMVCGSFLKCTEGAATTGMDGAPHGGEGRAALLFFWVTAFSQEVRENCGVDACGQALVPPSTVRFAPVMYDDSGLATNATNAATSSTVPKRPSAVTAFWGT